MASSREEGRAPGPGGWGVYVALRARDAGGWGPGLALAAVGAAADLERVAKAPLLNGGWGVYSS